MANLISDMTAPMQEPQANPMDALIQWYQQGIGSAQPNPIGFNPMGSPMDQSMAGQEGQLSMQALQILKNYTG